VAAKDDQEAAKVDTSCVVQIPRPLVWIPPKTTNHAKANRNGEQP
jgi:hypothetical protein